MTVIIDRRFCGPPESGNGGYVAGLLAERIATTPTRPAVSVRLSSPPPLDRALTLGGYGSLVLLQDSGRGIATASPAPALQGDLPEPVSLAMAQAAEAAYEGLNGHPFPTCFSCGTGRYAATWTPTEVTLPFVWAALDCPGGWSAGIAGRPMVLGTMTAQLLHDPTPAQPHVIVAWPRGGEGRKFLSGSALFTAQGDLLARAEATWITVDPAAVRPA